MLNYLKYKIICINIVFLTYLSEFFKNSQHSVKTLYYQKIEDY